LKAYDTPKIVFLVVIFGKHVEKIEFQKIEKYIINKFLLHYEN